MKLIKGFDYRTGRERDLSMREWRQEIALVYGATRRAEHGETFIHDKDGYLILEVYERVAP